MDFEPIWLKHIKDPKVKTILITGCGGGFDFTHSLLLIPTIIQLQKRFVIISNSFTQINLMKDYPVVYESKEDKRNIGRLITPKETEFRGYFPEIHLANFLAQRYGQDHGNVVYGHNANETSHKSNVEFYSMIINQHSIDMIITIDGGSDSLMRGDENDVATIYEDWLSLATISDLIDQFKGQILYGDLLTVGIGVDRFHGASDASSLRAIAELTRMGGFLGNCSIMPCSEGLHVYSDFIEYHNSKSSTSSIIQSMVLASSVGQFGPSSVKEIRSVERDLSNVPKSAINVLKLTQDGKDFSGCGNDRVDPKTTYIWPVMSNIYGFDIKIIVKRNPNVFLLRDEKIFTRFMKHRENMPVENFPRQQDICPFSS